MASRMFVLVGHHSIKKSKRASDDALRAATIHLLNSDYPVCEFVGARSMT
jgi:hypothetical protein